MVADRAAASGATHAAALLCATNASSASTFITAAASAADPIPNAASAAIASITQSATSNGV